MVFTKESRNTLGQDGGVRPTGKMEKNVMGGKLSLIKI